MDDLFTRVIDSPFGRLRLDASDQTLTGIGWPAPGMTDADESSSHPVLDRAAAQLAEYFRGERETFDLPLGLSGTPFQLRVWSALRELSFGETISYGALARRLGQPGAARAVGSANARNPLAIVVPCHRVVAGGGGLGGFAGGLAMKRGLLALEGVSNLGNVSAERPRRSS